ncbi:MAG: hypothetical protein ABI551_08185 [Polyangiaceae bacterium]
MQTLIDSFELQDVVIRTAPESGVMLAGQSAARATLLDVEEIAWFADDDGFDDEEVTLELDLEELRRPALAPRSRGNRVWTSE